MSINDQQQQSKWNMKILTIFTLIISTTVIMLLYKIQSGEITTKTTVSAMNVYHTTTNESTTNSHDNLLVMTIPHTITNTTINVTDNRIIRKHEISVPTFISKSKTAITEEKEPNNDFTSEFVHVTSRNLNNNITRDNADFIVRPSVSSSIKLPFIFKENSINSHYRNNIFMGNMNNNDVNNKTEVIFEPRMYQTNKRQINHDDYYPSTNIQQLSNGYASNSYNTKYDFTDNLDVNSYKGHQNPVYGSGWNTVGQLEQLNPGESLSEISGDSISWDQSHHVLENYTPKAHPSISTKHHNQKENKINWRTIAVLTFIKLGLAKLQTIGFLNMVLLLGFKFKLFFLALIFKFILLMKLMKFLNIVKLPLFILQLLPTLMQIISMAGQTIGALRRGTNMPLNQSNGLIPNIIQPGTIAMGNRIPGTMTGNIVPGQNTPNRIPGTSGTMTGNTIPGQTIGTRKSDMTMGTHILNENNSNSIPSGTGLSDFQLNALNYILNNGYNESYIVSYDPVIHNFEKLLDLEKCVERIACRVAGVEKTSIMPLWTYWVLHRISNLIPNDKLETYLKTYNDVKYNEMYTKLLTPENWTSWCLERYNCNSNNKISNVTDTN